jgi:urease accessory protein
MSRILKKISPYIAIAILSAILPSLFLAGAEAHTGVGEAGGFMHGLMHPLSGLDHIMAMVAVGLWAAQIGGRAVWAVPASFVSVMTLGAVLGVFQVHVPFVEQGIIASVLVLGVLIAAAVKNLPLVISMAIAGLFAIFHGYAHGAEMPVDISGLEYGIGFALSTILLHLGGIGLGVFMPKHVFVRWLGGAIALSSVYLILT